MCRKSLLLNHQTPTLRRHKATWLYHLPKSKPVTLRCYINSQRVTYTETLSGNGVITNATRCSISTTKLHTASTARDFWNTLHLYVPEKISIIDNQETQILEKISPELIQQLNDIKSPVMAPPRTLDLDSITRVHRTSLQRDQQTYWHLIIITTVCTVTIVGTFCFSLRFCLYCKILPCIFTNKPLNLQTELKTFPSSSSTPRPETNETTNEDPKKNVVFTTYYIPIRDTNS
jgi:hypothetical protein